MKQRIATDDRVVQFTATAGRFCRVIETHGQLSRRDLVHQCAELIAEVQMGFVRLLPVRTRFVAHRRHSAKMTHERRWRLFKSLGKKLGKDDGYYLVFNPSRIEPDDPVWTSLSDDLADIYRDLKEGLELIDRDNARDKHDAVWTWKFNFLAHTGHHCVSALRALQELIERYHED